jgi:hypothetical protein
MVLAGHPGAGGPVAVGAQAFPNPFVFPSGRICRNFNELALACVDDWGGARELLTQGYLETFLGSLGRIDLAMAAKASSKFPDHDRGLDDLLAKLPADVLPTPKLSVETTEINLGLLTKEAERRFQLKLENSGSRLLYGTITAPNTPWLTFGDQPGVTSKNFQFSHDLAMPVKVVGDRLRASHKPVETKLLIESSGGNRTIIVRAEIPVKTFPAGPLGGAKSPRQVAEKAKAAPKDAAMLFEKGAVRDWYKDNGWTYPVKGPDASGLAAVQQFFEALGLTPAPKVRVNQTSVTLRGNVGEKLQHAIEVKTDEKRAVHAYGESDQPWVEVGRARLSGRVATVPLVLPSVPNRPGETLTGKVTVYGNGNQRFVIPITLHVGSASQFDFAAPVPMLELVPGLVPVDAPMVLPVEAPAPSPVTPMAPAAVFVPPQEPIYVPRRHRGSGSNFKHMLAAMLLFLAVLTVVIVDLVMGGSGQAKEKGEKEIPLTKGDAASDDPATWKFAQLVNKDPLLGLAFNGDMRFGIVLNKEKDPENPLKKKKLTYEENGASNNTIVKIDNYDYYFGRTGGSTGAWVRAKDRSLRKNVEIPRKEIHPTLAGHLSEMTFGNSDVFVTQYVEVVPGASRELDTCLVWYRIENKSPLSRTVGIRVMIDTYIGANDGVPFTVPGVQDFVKDKATFLTKQIPDYIEVIEKPETPANPGTVARMGLRDIQIPGIDRIDEPEKLVICRWIDSSAPWDPPYIDIRGTGAPGERPDSCVILYWPTIVMEKDTERSVAFTYGLGKLKPISGAGGVSAALSVSKAKVSPGTEFTVVAYVWGGKAGQDVTINLPNGLSLVSGENKTKKLPAGGARDKVEWKVKAGSKDGEHRIKAITPGGEVEDTVNVKAGSIFG